MEIPANTKPVISGAVNDFWSASQLPIDNDIIIQICLPRGCREILEDGEEENKEKTE